MIFFKMGIWVDVPALVFSAPSEQLLSLVFREVGLWPKALDRGYDAKVLFALKRETNCPGFF